MLRPGEAIRTAERLLGKMTVEESETDTTRLYPYAPKGRARGGGFRLTVPRESGRAMNVLRYQ